MSQPHPNSPSGQPNLPPDDVTTRWYDEDPEVSQAVVTLRDLPEGEQELFARILITLFESWRRQDRLDGRAAMLGVDKHLGLHKSKTRKRWYDQNDWVHRAFNSLYQLDNTRRRLLCQKLHAAIRSLNLYKASCLQQERETQPGEIMNVVQTAIQQGENATRFYLGTLGLLEVEEASWMALPSVPSGEEPANSQPLPPLEQSAG
ncbi:MAG: hypothetical protein SFZ03_00055 [Candidatus Melainabacteria bacterium]|nr:hypothetical protein [Candidatus Melainabacteria bacterium]